MSATLISSKSANPGSCVFSVREPAPSRRTKPMNPKVIKRSSRIWENCWRNNRLKEMYKSALPRYIKIVLFSFIPLFVSFLNIIFTIATLPLRKFLEHFFRNC